MSGAAVRALLNHKGRLASDDYFILHPIGTVDCVPANVRLFRPHYWGFTIMVTEEFSEQLSAADFTGLRFIPAAGFRGIE